MAGANRVRAVARVASVVASFSLASGVFALAQTGTSVPVAVQESGAATPSTVVAAPPATTTTAPASIAPPITAPATTAAPRPATAPAPARAPVPARAYAAQTIQERGEAALALIDFPWQRLGYTVSFEPGRTGVLGLADSGERTVRIFVRDRDPVERLARTLAHELGHVLDYEFITPEEAARYIAIRGIDATPTTWFGCNNCTDYETAAGDFAEVFQYWLLGEGEFYSQMGPPPTAEQLAQVAQLFVIDTPADINDRT